MIERMARMAETMGLTVAQAAALPTAVTVAAGKVGMVPAAFLWHLETNAPLRDYVAGVCRTAAAAVA